jgi:hypothetical protein
MGSRVFDCLHNFVVTGAATQVASEGLGNFFSGGARTFLEQFGCRHDEARRAVSALDGAILHKGFLHGV